MLGKALFWDQQVGSDGMASANCHFSVGADNRIHNTWTPGFLIEPDEDTAFGAGGYDPASGFCIPNTGDLFAPGMQARSGGERVPLNE